MLNVRNRTRPVLVLLFSASLFLAPPRAAADDIVVFAAASLTNALGEIGQAFERQGGVKAAFSFASSSTLAKQIENGAPAQVFFSADTEWMDYLEKLRRIAPGSRADLLGNRLVLIAPADSNLSVTLKPGVDFASLLKGGLLATGDPDHVPVGKYAKVALGKLGAWDAISGRIARADSVRAALALVERGEAPLGIVYATDAAVAPKVKVIAVFSEDLHPPIIYPAALVQGRSAPAAVRFLDYLKTPEAKAVFQKYGFSVR
jgi:molybdate transport system substrate-binding protein